jgi:hypothetical protein
MWKRLHVRYPFLLYFNEVWIFSTGFRRSHRNQVLSKSVQSRNVMEPARQQMVIWRRVAWWFNKATLAQTQRQRPYTHPHPRYLSLSLSLTHSQRNMQEVCFSTATRVSWTRLIVTLYVHCVCCSFVTAVPVGFTTMVPSITSCKVHMLCV